MEPTPKLAQLLSQRAELDSTINMLMKEERQNAINSVRHTMAEFGLTVQDVSGPLKRIKTVRPPKYRDPATGNTWTGLGKRPQWISTQLEKGARLDSFLIGAPPAPSAQPKKPVQKRPAVKNASAKK